MGNELCIMKSTKLIVSLFCSLSVVALRDQKIGTAMFTSTAPLRPWDLGRPVGSLSLAANRKLM